MSNNPQNNYTYGQSTISQPGKSRSSIRQGISLHVDNSRGSYLQKMICKKCGSQMEVKSQLNIKRETQADRKIPTNYVCTNSECGNQQYEEYDG